MRAFAIPMTCLCLGVFAPPPAHAQKYRVVAPDDNVYDGVSSALDADPERNLFGETQRGPAPADGSVFELRADQAYTHKNTIYEFDAGLLGMSPTGGITFRHGSIFGTNQQGGTGQFGTVFDLGGPNVLSPMVLHAFTGKPKDGAQAGSGLVSGPHRLLYGATVTGGYSNLGTVFEISPSTTMPVYHVIHDFGAPGDTLVQPVTSKLVVDAQGSLYGITLYGGVNRRGGVYMLQKSDSVWTYTIIYSFGAGPDIFSTNGSNLVVDASGNLYGCGYGGAYGRGGVFRLAPPAEAGGAWQESVIYSFGKQSNDGIDGHQGCGLAIDPSSDYMVGTTPLGGYSKSNGDGGYGVLFSLKPSVGRNHWVERVEHEFFGSVIDGGHPVAPPYEIDGTFYGGNTMNGSIYAFTP